MASEVDICNMALIEVGGARIMSLGEDNKPGRLCKLYYPLVRDMILRGHPWNFAQKRAELALTTDTPSFEYGFAFQLPSDCLKVIKTDDQYDVFKIEGKTLLTNNSSCSILYTSRVEDTTHFDSLFIEAFAAKLGGKLCYNLSDNNTLVQLMEARYKSTLRQAKSMDGQEGIIDNVEADEWLNSRG